MPVVLVLALLMALGSPVARAHADVPLIDGTLRVEPGAAIEIPMALHFHRLVARYEVHGVGAPGLTLAVVRGADAAADSPVPHLLEVTLDRRGRVNRLIACCRDEAYADLKLVVRHDGEHPVTVDLRAWAMHDEFAVVAGRAEAGAFGVPLTLFALLGASAPLAALRARRRLGTGARPAARPGRYLWASGGLLVAASAVALGLAGLGMVRYGAGPIEGVIAALADLPVPGGPFGSRAASLLGLLLVLWMAAIGAWIAGVGQGVHRASPWAVPLGALFALMSVATGLAMSWTYDGSWVPTVLGAVLAVPLGAVALSLRRQLVPS